jgi:hypothetical protein
VGTRGHRPVRQPGRLIDHPARLTDLQVDLAGIFFSLDAARGYLIAGGAALLACDLIDRPTEDLDLFTAAPTTTVTAAKDAFVHALHRRGYTVAVVNDGPTFCRIRPYRVWWTGRWLARVWDLRRMSGFDTSPIHR